MNCPRTVRLLAVVTSVSASACGSSGGGGTPTTPTPPPTPATYTLSGTVSESGGGRIQGATVRIGDGTNSGRSATTDANGQYSLTGLQSSSFTASASADGYASRGQGINLTANRTADFALTRLGPRTSFGAGQYLVGTDILPGRYFTDPSSGCYWERQSGLSGNISDVIANEFIGFNALQWIVDIAGSDRGFETDSECGRWDMTPRGGQQSSIQPGVWLVGSQITAGTYRANVNAGCYWERRRDFSGTIGGVLDNEFVSSPGQQIVDIRSTDVGFHNDSDCGTWTRISAEPIIGERRSTAGTIEENWRLHRQRWSGPRL